MQDYSPDPVRAEGPPAVTHGESSQAAVLVLDPSGAAKHGQLPATWRELAEDRRITWCRLPSDGALTEAEEALAESPPAGPTVDIVASGPFADAALRLAERHTESVRSVLLVDPGAEGYVQAEHGEPANRDWEQDNAGRMRELEREGVAVKVVAHSTGGERDRVPAPLPLGHPDVVSAIRAALVDDGD